MKTPCIFCKHHVVKPDLKLFEDSDLSHPEVLKANNEFESQKKAIRKQESDNVRDEPCLNYEPEFFGWCRAMFPFSYREHGEILDKLVSQDITIDEATIDEARQRLKLVTEQFSVLKEKASKKDMQAVIELYDRGAVEIGSQFSIGNIEYHYPIAQNVNVNKKSDSCECPLFEKKTTF